MAAARLRAARAALVLGVLAAGCSALREPWPPASAALGQGVDDLDPASLAVAAERTAEALAALPGEREFAAPLRTLRVSQLEASARHVARIARSASSPEELTRRLARDCRAVGAGAPAKVTAYFEPILQARRARDTRFRFPLYAMPTPEQLAAAGARLGRVPTRADIDGGGALAGLGLELAWTDDAVALFFLHVQGSGRLLLEDGAEVRVGFAGTNGLDYRSVGAAMLAEGLLERGDATATAMRRWLAANPSRRDEVLFRNPRYVFFRETGADGPKGSLGATLVAGRSAAADADHVPPGALLWLQSSWPRVDRAGRGVGSAPLSRFLFAQDSGAAIRGAGRLDLFAGSGEAAGLEAGAANEKGELFLLLCRRARTAPLTGPRAASPLGRRR